MSESSVRMFTARHVVTPGVHLLCRPHGRAIFDAPIGNPGQHMLQGAENADRIFKSLLRCLRVARRIDSKEVLTKVLNTMWALQVVAIVREVQQGLVVDCDMAIFEGLGARFEQLDMS